MQEYVDVVESAPARPPRGAGRDIDDLERDLVRSAERRRARVVGELDRAGTGARPRDTRRLDRCVGGPRVRRVAVALAGARGRIGERTVIRAARGDEDDSSEAIHAARIEQAASRTRI